MSADRIPSYDAAEILARINIGELFPGMNGRAKQHVLCPFHDDGRKPSCYVDTKKQRFHCFGCGKHGDAIDYFGYTTHSDGWESAKHSGAYAEVKAKAAVYAHCEPTERHKYSPKPTRDPLTEAMAERARTAAELASRPDQADALAAKQALFMADVSPAAVEYWEGRGFDIDTARRYGMGFRQRWQGAARVTFPYTLPDGEIRRHYGRAIPPHPEKYTGRDGQPRDVAKGVYTSRAELGLEDDAARMGGWFNAPAMLTEPVVIFVEGVPDALALIQSGYPGAIATGTQLGPYALEWFTGWGALPRRVVIAFNRDTNAHQTGQTKAAALKAELDERFMGTVRAEIIHPPEGYNDWAEMLAASVPIVLEGVPCERSSGEDLRDPGPMDMSTSVDIGTPGDTSAPDVRPPCTAEESTCTHVQPPAIERAYAHAVNIARHPEASAELVAVATEAKELLHLADNAARSGSLNGWRAKHGPAFRDAVDRCRRLCEAHGELEGKDLWEAARAELGRAQATAATDLFADQVQAA